MSSNIFRRSVVGTVAIAGALGLAACNNDTASVSKPTGSAPTAVATSKATTEPAPPTSSEAPTSEQTSTSSEPSESSTSESSTAAAGGSKSDAKVTPDGTKLKFGESAVIDDESDGKYKLKVKSITAAPESAYATANLNKSNGKMYYVNFDVTNLGGAKYGFRATAPNQFFLKPVFDSSEKGRAGGSPYQDLPGCKKSSYDEIPVGGSGSACYYYQVTGPAPSKVMWDTYETEIVWSK